MTLPVVEFLTQRMQEYDPSYELRPGTAFTDLFILPISYITQPMVDQMALFQMGQSIIRILQLQDPNAYPEENVDSLVGNLYVTRILGNTASGIARLLYQNPIPLNYVASSLEFRNTEGLRYTNSVSVFVSPQEMSGNVYEEFYYVDVPIVAEKVGIQYNAPPYGIVFVNDPYVIRVFNEYEIVGGKDQETNTALLNRTKESIGVRDMNTGSGLVATFYENFPAQITSIQGIGFLYPEMMRDIYYNFHIGGMIDAWIKTQTIQLGTFSVTALNLDYTRIMETTASLQMIDTDWISLGTSSLDESETRLTAMSTKYANAPAEFVSYADLTLGVDLLNNRFISLGTDTIQIKNINVSGSIPAATTGIEIVNAINKAMGITVASLVSNPMIINTANTGNTTAVNSASFWDATEAAFYNVLAEDFLAVLIGTSTGTYKVVQVISDNELLLDRAIPTILVNASYSISRGGLFIKLKSPSHGMNARLTIAPPVGMVGNSALERAFGLLSSATFIGRGPIEYVRDIDYEVDTSAGEVRRIVATPPVVTGIGFIDPGIYFSDTSSLNSFFAVQAGDILTVYRGGYGTDYRILGIPVDLAGNQDLQRVRVDVFFHVAETSLRYEITRTGIRNGAMVLYTFGYNPLSIDIGNLVSLGPLDRVLGIRPGREQQTIQDLAYLWTDSIEVIDPATGSPTGEVLDPIGGYGQGGYGMGPYGIGNRADYRLQTYKPELRFSALEDSVLIINDKYLGDSLKVTFRYAPDLVAMYYFATSDANRVLDAEVVPKHYIPALVTMHVTYKVQSATLLTTSDEELTASLVNFINTRPGKYSIDSSDVIDLLLKNIDPSRTSTSQIITPFEMRAEIQNTDGSTTIVSSPDSLQIPDEPIPKYTPAPLSPRTAHWIALDVTVVRVT